MKKDNRINPVGLKGNQINERMIQLMGITPINENHNNSVVELTKIGPDGNAYAIVRENHEYYIKIARKAEGIVAEDFKYIGGLMNKKSEAYPSYAKAIKHLNLKFKSLAEAYGKGSDINVFENDNLIAEYGGNGFSGGFSDTPKGGGFTGEGNLEGNKPLYEDDSEDMVDKGNDASYEKAFNEMGDEDVEECELSEVEQAIDNMGKDDVNENASRIKQLIGQLNKKGKKVTVKNVIELSLATAGGTVTDKEEIKNIINGGNVNEHKLSILRALENMDTIIDTLTEGRVKKKVYTLK